MNNKIVFKFFIISSLVLIFSIASTLGAAQTPNRAALVVQFEDGRTETQCIEFSETDISGYELLQRSDYSIIASFESQGAAICKIDDIGCPADDCFCQSPPDYWSYWHLENGSWSYSSQGSSNSIVENGNTEGWAWGPGQPPPLIPFNEICLPATATPSATFTPTITQTPLPSPTSQVTATPIPTQQATPTSSPYPPPQSPVNTPNPYLPPDRNTSIGNYPPPANQPNKSAPEINNPQAAVGAPLNPHIILPAKLVIGVTPVNSPTLAPNATPLVSTAAVIVKTTGNNQDTAVVSSPSYLNYWLFGALALSLLSVVSYQSIVSLRKNKS
jgi:hypothetical protein